MRKASTKSIRIPKKRPGRIRSLFFSSPKLIFYVVTFTLLGAVFVLVRMKGVEQAYALNQIEQKIHQVGLENKELKARRANLLSIRNLKDLSRKFQLSEPDQAQIIVIPQ